MKRIFYYLCIMLTFLSFNVVVAQKLDSLRLKWTSGSVSSKVQAAIDLSNYYFYKNPDTASYFMKNGLQLARQNKLVSKEIYLLNNLGVFYNENGQYLKAKNYLHQELKLARQNNDTMQIISALGNLGNNSMLLGNFENALEYFTGIASMFQRMKNSKGLGNVYGAMGNLYRQKKEPRKALQYYEKAMDQFERTGDTLHYAIGMMNAGYILIDLNNTDKATRYFHQTYDVFNRHQIPLNAGKSLDGLTRVEMKTGHLDHALEYAQKALEIFKKLNNKSDMSVTYGYLGQIAFKKGAYHQAIENYKKSYNFDSVENNYFRLQIDALALKRCYDSIGNYALASSYANKYIAFHDSVYDIQSAKKFSELEIKYETAQKEQRITKLELEKTRDRMFIWGIAGLFLMFLAGIYILLQKRKKARKITELELEKSQILAQNLSDQLELKNKQLTGHALNMMQKNELLSAFAHGLSEIITMVTGEAVTKLKSLKREVNKLLTSEKDWDTFKISFEQVNKDFLSKLKEINSNLTTNDIRLATLIKLNMTNKEIASILNINYQSVKNAQYRLKSKLNLNAGIDLRQFLADL